MTENLGGGRDIMVEATPSSIHESMNVSDLQIPFKSKS